MKRLIAALLFAVACQAAAVLQLGPIVSPSTGATFLVPVSVTGVSDLYAASFDVGFDPTRLTYVDVAEGDFLATAGSTIFIPGTESGPGAVQNTAISLIGPVSGATGSGTLAVLRFRAEAAGLTTLTIFAPLLLDSSISGINVDAVPLAVEVQTGTVPEPATTMLVLVGLAAFRMRRT